jgi:hypothetical protein
MTQKPLPGFVPKEFALRHTALILSSYRKWTGRDLIPPHQEAEKQACALFWESLVVITSDNAADPLLTYGNQKALDLWQISWPALTQTRGRNTAEPLHRTERENFLKRVRDNGFVEDYSGVRISSTGKRFKIEQATVWNLVDETDLFIGQAAAFSKWTNLD